MKRLFTLFVLVAVPLFTADSQIIKTQLSLTVRDELGNTVDGASVLLYESEADFAAEKNEVAKGATDKKGGIKFKELKAIGYFVIVRKGDKDNIGGGEKIEPLVANRINKATIVIQ